MYLSAHIEPAPNGSIKIGEAPRCPAVYQISTYVLYIWGPFLASFMVSCWGVELYGLSTKIPEELYQNVIELFKNSMGIIWGIQKKNKRNRAELFAQSNKTRWNYLQNEPKNSGTIFKIKQNS